VKFVAPKLGFSNTAASGYLGSVHLVGIGAPRVLVGSVAGGASWTG